MGDSIGDLCEGGLLPKLPFQLEEKEESELVSAFLNPSEGYFPPDQISSIPISIQERKEILSSLLDKISHDDTWWPQISPKSRASIVLFLGESSKPRVFWSDKDCAQLTEQLSARLGLETWFRRNCNEQLTPNETDLYFILQSVRDKLVKSNWKYFPATVHASGWILQQISSPSLENYLEFIIPPSLLFSDDHYDDFKLIGLTCLAHIVQISDKFDLSRNNWGTVIFDAAKRHLLDKDPQVIQLMMTILFKTLAVIEKNPASNCTQFTKYDFLLKDILFQMEVGSDPEQKLVWLPILNNYIKTMGLATLHWSDKILLVLRDFTISNNFQIWREALKVLKSLIRSTWVKVDGEKSTEIIVRAIFNVSCFKSTSFSDENTQEIVVEAGECLNLLKKCGGLDESALDQLKSLQNERLFRPEFKNCLQQLI